MSLLENRGVRGDVEFLCSAFSPLDSIQPVGTGPANSSIVTFGQFDGVTTVTSPYGDIVMQPDGQQIINSTHTLLPSIFYNYGRATNNGITQLGFYSELSFDGGFTWTPDSFPLPGLIDAPGDQKSEVLLAPVKFPPGTRVRQRVMIDAASGAAVGGLFKTPLTVPMVTLAGTFAYTPCIEVRWSRLI